MSARVVAAVLKSKGIESTAFDAGDFLVTDDHFQSAIPIWDETQRRVNDKLVPAIMQGITPVITGFIGATTTGAITTLDAVAAITAVQFSQQPPIAMNW